MFLQLGNVLRGGIARAWGWHNFTFARHCPWISKANIHFRPSRMRRWISPHPHTSWLCWTVIFAICEIVSLCLGFNLHQPDYNSLRLARLSVFTSLLIIPASCLWVGCSYLCLFFSLVVYLFPSWFVGTLNTINIHHLSKNIFMPLSSPSQFFLFVYGVWCNIHVFNFGIKLPVFCAGLCVLFVCHKDMFIIVSEVCFYL